MGFLGNIKSQTLIARMRQKVYVGRINNAQEVMSDSASAQAQRDADSRFLYGHYTNMEGMLHILQEREFIANRIDRVDDKKEATYLQPLIDEQACMPYVTCFDYKDNESIPLWNMYTNPETGVLLKFRIKKSKSSPTFRQGLIDFSRKVKAFVSERDYAEFPFCTSPEVFQSRVSVSTWMKDVVYDEGILPNSFILINGKKYLNYTLLAGVKSEDWDFQRESRLVTMFQLSSCDGQEQEIDNYIYLKIPVHFDNLERLEVTFGPWMGERTKDAIRHEVDILNIPVEYKDSKHTGKIERK